MIERESRGGGGNGSKSTERDLRAIGRMDVNIFQRVGSLLKLRIGLQDDVILVELGVNG